MAMNKAEKARMTELETALALCWPPYAPPTPMTDAEIKTAPQVDAGGAYGYKRTAAAGFFINSHSGTITAGFSCGTSHSRDGYGSWGQEKGQMYRTKREAAMALRHKMTAIFAQKLAAIDAIIKANDDGK